MATANVIQIIASFIGGTVVTAGILKATASSNIGNNTSSSSNTNVINDHQIPEQQQPSTSTTSNTNNSDNNNTKNTSSTDINLALISSITVVLGLSFIYFNNKTTYYLDSYDKEHENYDDNNESTNNNNKRESAIQIKRLEKDIETWRKRYKDKMKEILKLKKRVVEVQRNAELTFGQGMEDNFTLIHENRLLREQNLKLDKHLTKIQTKLEKLRKTYATAGPKSTIFGKRRDVINAEQDIKKYLRKITPKIKVIHDDLINSITTNNEKQQRNYYLPSPKTNKQKINQ